VRQTIYRFVLCKTNGDRNDAPSGLGLSLEKLRGVQVSDSFEATPKGIQAVRFSDDPIKGVNKIFPSPAKQAAVTFGAGVTTQELNNALDKSGLFTMGAAHGSCSYDSLIVWY
jgi:FAD/FMN-containing dehydrogenase